MDEAIKSFLEERRSFIGAQGSDPDRIVQGMNFVRDTLKYKYSYNFDWLGRPIIQFPQDIVAIQEILWQVKPDLVIETGIAHGGSLILSASILALIDYAEAVESGTLLDPAKPKRHVLGIDIEIRPHNRAAIKAHPLQNRIEMIEGSSIDHSVISEVNARANGMSRVVVILDSNHTHDHVLAELNAYASLTSIGSYCVVFDTVIEDMPADAFPDRLWGKGNNPKTAVKEFLKSHSEFEVDRSIQNKLLISVAPEGFLKRIR
jgi:cephalosporin hydroxylase